MKNTVNIREYGAISKAIGRDVLLMASNVNTPDINGRWKISFKFST